MILEKPLTHSHINLVGLQIEIVFELKAIDDAIYLSFSRLKDKNLLEKIPWNRLFGYISNFLVFLLPTFPRTFLIKNLYGELNTHQKLNSICTTTNIVASYQRQKYFFSWFLYKAQQFETKTPNHLNTRPFN
ncbi:hypothetical protein BpHYR1_025136 [Brachionus plicatilis]|uniref:Uncharacterized protein n=1 Tax=Brachionus plicatilis TaxID=10195 RepID=A0A3M7RRY1_BRAPC|nr:hypothetical protein BpHYR1_025136 [Brachionus plicatilis]